ncbi:putative retrotransposon hot spot protein (RHS) [Trypanosoma cruzi]|uniref:Putative retrotransposon hot spot protein (RHS) n=1 Tax=Trypanosoma cruzi TaxID=5693 RepID=A0A2V2XJ67_TRYCR|nr:putative retrotransposon hot spot protein (RHS) [Trypanosoma cruzi]
MKYERQRHGTLLPCTPQIFSIKHASCTLFCSVGDYHDASLLVEFTIWGSCMWLLLHRIHFPLVSVGLCPWRCAHALLQSVCGVGGATRVRNRGERYAWTNPPCAPRCCCWLSPTLCWWMASIYRCGGLRAYGFYRILRRHTVWVSLLLWPRFMTVSVVFFFSFLFFVWWLLFRSNSN